MWLYADMPKHYAAERIVYRIIVNIAERTLTLFKQGSWYKSFPVAVGKPSKPTPRGIFRIKNKAVPIPE